jgi:tetratricopeptide (TPR) repeat protein
MPIISDRPDSTHPQPFVLAAPRKWPYDGKAMALVRGFVVVLVGCLALTAPSRSMAADPDQVFAEGQRLFRAGDHRGALKWFKNGYLQTQDPAFLLDIAQCHRALGENQEALMMFRLYLKSSPEATNPEARAVTTQAIKEIEREAKSAPRNLVAPATAAPAPAPAAAPGAPPTTYSARKFKTDPGGMPALEPTPELDGTRAAEAATGVPNTTENRRRRLRLAAVVCGAVGLASVGIGVYYWTRARSLSDSANQASVYNRAVYDDGKRAETMQWIFYGVGAAAVATGAALYWFGWRRPGAKESSLALVPLLGPSAAGVAGHGAF